jgi:hypothetical protein
MLRVTVMVGVFFCLCAMYLVNFGPVVCQGWRMRVCVSPPAVVYQNSCISTCVGVWVLSMCLYACIYVYIYIYLHLSM